MDLTEWKYFSIAKLTTFQSHPIQRGYLTRPEHCFLQKIILDIVFRCQITLKLFILCSKLSALHFAYAQRSYRNHYFPGEKETRTNKEWQLQCKSCYKKVNLVLSQNWAGGAQALIYWKAIILLFALA
jgi:hypothetical protein